MRIPSFLGKKFYVKGSLRNSAYGFLWEMRNVFAPAMLWEVASLEIDGRVCPLERVVLHPPGGAAIRAREVNRHSPLRFDLGAEVRVEVEGNPLPVGAHKIVLRLRMAEVEEIEFSLEDYIWS
jgi:hypothetical protein